MQRPAVEPARLGRTRVRPGQLPTRFGGSGTRPALLPRWILVRLVHLHRAPSAFAADASPPTSPHRIACFDDGLHHGRRPTGAERERPLPPEMPPVWRLSFCQQARSAQLDADPQRLRPQRLSFDRPFETRHDPRRPIPSPKDESIPLTTRKCARRRTSNAPPTHDTGPRKL